MPNRLFGLLAALALGIPMLQGQAPKPARKGPQVADVSRRLVKHWTVADLEGLLGAGLEGGRNYDHGRALFRQATCLACHRFNQEGSAAGPDLGVVATQYGPLEMLVHVIEPGREIGDRYRQQEVTLKDGRKMLGRAIKQTADTLVLSSDMTRPKETQSIDRGLIVSMGSSKVSLMPSGLLDKFNEIEILDLLAYLLSKGDREDPMFK